MWAAAAFAAHEVAAHATFQDLWVNGVDEQAICVRLPPSNSPVTDVTSTDIRCNVGGTSGISGKCAVAAGQIVTVEMHQQPGDRSCANEAIGGDHYGPVQVYLTKVADASTADGSTSWFKIFEDTWSAAAGASSGDDDNWGTKDLNTCCGRMNVLIPKDIAPGDYLLRAEVIALHVASSTGGAQFYMSCYQLTISGSGTATPSGVSLPGAYSASDPGILINIHTTMSTYIVPGPTVYSSGTTKSAGAPCSGIETGTTTGPPYTPTGGSSPTSGGSSPTTSTPAIPTSSSGPTSGCSVTKYGQCGGSGYSGCATCQSGTTCSAVSPPYYSQCL